MLALAYGSGYLQAGGLIRAQQPNEDGVFGRVNSYLSVKAKNGCHTMNV